MLEIDKRKETGLSRSRTVLQSEHLKDTSLSPGVMTVYMAQGAWGFTGHKRGL